MKFEIKQEILMEHLNYVIKGVSSKNLRPILNCIKLSLTDEGLYLMSTDNEIAIKTFIPEDKIERIDTLGSIVVSGRYLFEIIRKLPNDIVKIEEVIDSKIFITTTNSSFNLNCSSVSEFPDLELEFSKTPLVINQRLFKTLINQTSFATSTQESRPVLTGISFNVENNLLECTATDSYRLSSKKIELSENYPEKVSIIIPTKNISELMKLFNNDEDDIEIHIFNNKIIFKFESIVFMSRLINGTYPDTSKLIPNEFSLIIKVKLDNFYSAIDRASLLTNEADKNTIKLETKGNTAIVSSNIPEIGNVEEKFEITKDKDEEIKIAFSSKFMLDSLRVLDSEEIEICLNGELKPIILKNSENDSLIELILPIRTF